MTDNFQKGYSILFNGITDALTEIENANYGKARMHLIRAQQDAEEVYINTDTELNDI